MKLSESIEILKDILGEEIMADILIAFSMEAKEVRTIAFPPLRKLEAWRKEECITRHLKIKEEQTDRYKVERSTTNRPFTVRDIAGLCGVEEKEIRNIQRRAERKMSEADEKRTMAHARILGRYLKLFDRREQAKEKAAIKRTRNKVL